MCRLADAYAAKQAEVASLREEVATLQMLLPPVGSVTYPPGCEEYAGAKQVADLRAKFAKTEAVVEAALRWRKANRDDDGTEDDAESDFWDALRALGDSPPSDPASEVDARIYPCRECGKLRSKAEGGTTFAVCDECWDDSPVGVAATAEADIDRLVAARTGEGRHMVTRAELAELRRRVSALEAHSADDGEQP